MVRMKCKWPNDKAKKEGVGWARQGGKAGALSQHELICTLIYLRCSEKWAV